MGLMLLIFLPGLSETILYFHFCPAVEIYMQFKLHSKRFSDFFYSILADTMKDTWQI